MAKTHPRSPSPELKTSRQKRPKIVHESPATTPTTTDAVTPAAQAPAAVASQDDVAACFAPDLFDAENVGRLAASYSASEPFKHALIEKLFRDDLLQRVKDECLGKLHFTEKETDIYKVTLRFLVDSNAPFPSSHFCASPSSLSLLLSSSPFLSPLSFLFSTDFFP